MIDLLTFFIPLILFFFFFFSDLLALSIPYIIKSKTCVNESKCKAESIFTYNLHHKNKNKNVKKNVFFFFGPGVVHLNKYI